MGNTGEEDQQSIGVSLKKVTSDLGAAMWALPDEMRETHNMGVEEITRERSAKDLEEEEIHMWKGLVWCGWKVVRKRVVGSEF